MGKKSEKRIRQQFEVSSKATPRRVENPDSFYDLAPVWSFKRCDFDHGRWGFVHLTDTVPSILKKLRDFEGQKWADILTSKGGRVKNTRNHFIALNSIIKDAQSRAIELKLDEFGQLLSLSLNNRERIWGLLIDGIFYVIWYDDKHEIYPSHKRHT